MKWVAVAVFIAFSTAAWGDTSVTATGGYGAGTLQTSSTVAVRAYPVTVSMKYEGPVFGAGYFLLGAAFQRQDLYFKEEGAEFSGAGILYGGSLGFRAGELGAGSLRFEAVYYATSGLAVASESRGFVNGKAFKHSTLQTYSGPGAGEFVMTYLIEKTGGSFNRQERLRYGLSLSYFQQSFTEVETQVAVSDAKIAPRGRTVETVDYGYALAGCSVVIGYAF